MENSEILKALFPKRYQKASSVETAMDYYKNAWAYYRDAWTVDRATTETHLVDGDWDF